MAQRIRAARAGSDVQERHVPMNTRGKSLLSGNVYCGHCGARLALTTNGKSYPCKEDPHRVVKRVRYICYGKTRTLPDCRPRPRPKPKQHKRPEASASGLFLVEISGIEPLTS